MKNLTLRVISTIVTFAFIFTQCGIGMAAPTNQEKSQSDFSQSCEAHTSSTLYKGEAGKVGQNLRVANVGDPGREVDAKTLGAEVKADAKGGIVRYDKIIATVAGGLAILAATTLGTPPSTTTIPTNPPDVVQNAVEEQAVDFDDVFNLRTGDEVAASVNHNEFPGKIFTVVGNDGKELILRPIGVDSLDEAYQKMLEKKVVTHKNFIKDKWQITSTLETRANKRLAREAAKKQLVIEIPTTNNPLASNEFIRIKDAYVTSNVEDGKIRVFQLDIAKGLRDSHSVVTYKLANGGIFYVEPFVRPIIRGDMSILEPIHDVPSDGRVIVKVPQRGDPGKLYFFVIPEGKVVPRQADSINALIQALGIIGTKGIEDIKFLFVDENDVKELEPGLEQLGTRPSIFPFNSADAAGKIGDAGTGSASVNAAGAAGIYNDLRFRISTSISKLENLQLTLDELRKIKITTIWGIRNDLRDAEKILTPGNFAELTASLKGLEQLAASKLAAAQPAIMPEAMIESGAVSIERDGAESKATGDAGATGALTPEQEQKLITLYQDLRIAEDLGNFSNALNQLSIAEWNWLRGYASDQNVTDDIRRYLDDTYADSPAGIAEYEIERQEAAMFSAGKQVGAYLVQAGIKVAIVTNVRVDEKEQEFQDIFGILNEQDDPRVAETVIISADPNKDNTEQITDINKRVSELKPDRVIVYMVGDNTGIGNSLVQTLAILGVAAVSITEDKVTWRESITSL